MRDRFPLLMLGALLIGLLLGGLMVRSAQRGSYAEASSTYRAGEDGARALYLLARELGLPVERRTGELLYLEQGTGLVFLGISFLHPPEDWAITAAPSPLQPFHPQGAGPAVDGAPSGPPATNLGAEPDAATQSAPHPTEPSPESDAATQPAPHATDPRAETVPSGAPAPAALPSDDVAPGEPPEDLAAQSAPAPVPVTAAPGHAPDPDDDAPEEPDPDPDAPLREGSEASVSGPELQRLLLHVSLGHHVLHAPAGDLDDALLEALGVSLASGPADSAPRLLVPSTPHPLTRGIAELHAPLSAYLDALPEDAIPLFEDTRNGRPVAAWIPHGKGGVVVHTAPGLFDNAHLRRLDNAPFALRLLAWVAQDGRAQFDEYHHGFASQRSLVSFGQRHGLHWAVLQLLVGLAVWALSLRRFGRPRPPDEEVRNTREELLGATARLYREGRHAIWCAAQLTRWLTHSLAPIAGLRPQADPQDVQTALERRGLHPLAEAYDDALRSAAVATTPKALLETARATAHAFHLSRDTRRPHPTASSRKRDAA